MLQKTQISLHNVIHYIDEEMHGMIATQCACGHLSCMFPRKQMFCNGATFKWLYNVWEMKKLSKKLLCVWIYVCTMCVYVDKISDWIGERRTSMLTYDISTACVNWVRFVWLHTRAFVFHVVACACTNSCHGSQCWCCDKQFYRDVWYKVQSKIDCVVNSSERSTSQFCYIPKVLSIEQIWFYLFPLSSRVL